MLMMMMLLMLPMMMITWAIPDGYTGQMILLQMILLLWLLLLLLNLQGQALEWDLRVTLGPSTCPCRFIG